MKKKLLIVNNTMGEGGAEKVLLDVLNHIDYNRYAVKLVIINKKGMRFENINKNVKVKTIFPDINSKIKFIQTLDNFIKYRAMKHFYNIIYFFKCGLKNDIEIAFLEGEPTRFVAKSLNKTSKKIAWIHTDLKKCRPEQVNFNDEFYYRVYDNVICVSNSAKQSFDSLYPHLKDRSSTIYNIVDYEMINQKKNEKIEIQTTKRIIVSVGRLTEMKRFDLVIKAHKELLNKNIENQLLIIGIGEREKELKFLVNQLGIQDSVHFLGYKSNPYPYIANADIFVLASDFEGFSLVVAEAMCLGKKIVASDNGGATEILDNGEYGSLFKPGDLEELVQCLERNLQNLDIKNEEERVANLKRRVQIFQPKHVMNQIYNIIDDV